MRLATIFGLLALLAAPAHAQSVNPSCGGEVKRENTSSQLGTNGWIQYTVTTSVVVNICTTRVLTDAHVAGITGSALHSEGFSAASAQKQVPTPYDGVWTTNGKHWYQTALIPGLAISAGESQSVALSKRNSPADDCALLGADYYWNGSECMYTPGSPILLDMSGRGYRLTSLANGVMFDITGDGQPEQVSWTAANAENAFLAYDRNGNGTIDDGTELFGTATPVQPAGDPDLQTASNGFEALRFFEAAVSTTLSDDRVTPGDPAFSSLLLWTDRNHNGVSEPDELVKASDAGLSSIGLNYREGRRRDRFGNEFRQAAVASWDSGRRDVVFDVWFKFER